MSMADIWILIIFLTFGDGGGPATAEFTSKARCETAAQAIIIDALTHRKGAKFSYRWWSYVCVRK